jgi:hypothetical protein
VVTGPGGVLWGANSFLGHRQPHQQGRRRHQRPRGKRRLRRRPGSPQDFRAYVLFGKSFRFKRGPKLSIVQHVSYETYIAPRYNVLSSISRNAAPSPVGPHVYSVFTDTNPERSYIVNVDGKISLRTGDAGVLDAVCADEHLAVVCEQSDERPLGHRH